MNDNLETFIGALGERFIWFVCSFFALPLVGWLLLGGRMSVLAELEHEVMLTALFIIAAVIALIGPSVVHGAQRRAKNQANQKEQPETEG